MRIPREAVAVASVVVLAFGVALLTDLGGRSAMATTAQAVDEILVVPASATGSGQTLFYVNTLERKILVYRTEGGSGGGRLMLNAVRDYKYDLILDEWPSSKGGGGASPTTIQVREMLGKHPDYEKNKKDGKYDKDKTEREKIDHFVKDTLKPSNAKTLLATISPGGGGSVSAGGAGHGASGSASGGQADHVYLTDTANKKILVYQMSSDKLSLVAVRKYEYDEKIPGSADYNTFHPWEEIKKLYEEAKKKEEEENKRNGG